MNYFPLSIAKKKSDDIGFIRENLFPVSQPRTFHFVMPKGKEWIEWPAGSNTHYYREIGYGGDWTKFD